MQQMSVPSPELELAVALAEQDCLSRQGLHVTLQRETFTKPWDVYVSMVGVFRSEEIAMGGYSSTFVDNQETYSGFDVSAMGDSERSRFELALLGPDDAPHASYRLTTGMEVAKSTMGCGAIASERVYGSVLNELKVGSMQNEVNQLSGEYRNERSLRLLTILPNYEACMRDNGYQVSGLTGPQVAGESFGQYRRNGDGPSAAEERLAVTDFECQQKAGLQTALLEMFAAHAGSWVSKNQAMIAAHRELCTEALGRARAIIDGG